MDLTQIKVKRYRSSRHLRLKVLPDGQVVVTAPLLTPPRSIERFLLEHQEWLGEQVAKVKQNQQELTNSRDRVFFRGQALNFRLSVKPQDKPRVERVGETLLVKARAEDHAQIRLLMEEWYKKEAKRYLEERVRLLGDLVGLDVNNVVIRSSRTRWGSCSSRGHINLNWRLIQAPDSVSDYVVYHELAHRRQMNHSPAFWRLVESWCPTYKEAENWLKSHHRLLEF